MKRRHTLDGLEALAWAERDAGRTAHVEVDREESVAVLVVNGRETGDYASLEEVGSDG